MSIPKHAKKVFKGEIFDVYQWPQKEFDGNFATYEHLKRADTVIVIPITHDKKIVLIEEEQPNKPLFLTAVAGKIELSENPEQAAEREMLEEIGYKAKNLNLWYSFNPVSKIDWTVYVYIAKDAKKISEPSLEPGERILPIIFDFEGFLEAVLKEKFRDLSLKVKVLEAKLSQEKMMELKKKLLS